MERTIELLDTNVYARKYNCACMHDSTWVLNHVLFFSPNPKQDSWEAVRIGDELILRGLKACGRCKMTRVHQEQGYVTGEEPLKTLKE